MVPEAKTTNIWKAASLYSENLLILSTELINQICFFVYNFFILLNKKHMNVKKNVCDSIRNCFSVNINSDASVKDFKFQKFQIVKKIIR